MKIAMIALLMAGLLFIAGCTVLGASVESEGLGIKVKGSLAGLSTETGLDLSHIMQPEETP